MPGELPIPAPHRRSPIPALRDVPSPDTARMDAYIEKILSEMPGEWPIRAPRWRRPIPALRDVPSPDMARMDLHRGDPFRNAGRAAHLAPRRRRPIPAPRDVPFPNTTGMDTYIEEILSEMQGERPIPAPRRQRPIFNVPIPETVKRRLLKPLQPVKYRPPHPSPKDRKRKATEEEFDPIPRQKSLRSVGEYQDEILDLFTVPKDDKLVFRQTP